MKERDFSKAKKDLWDRMTGNIKELNDANSNGNINVYPNVSFTNEGVNIEPSIVEERYMCLCHVFSATTVKCHFLWSPFNIKNTHQNRIKTDCRFIYDK